MNVTGDRTAEHGLATVGYDDEGVAAPVVGPRQGRHAGRLPARPADGRGSRSSAGPTAAPSPTPPGTCRCSGWRTCRCSPPPGGPSTEELIGGVERGIYVVGDKTWSIDMQRYNFQFTGQRFFRIENGRLAGQLRDVAYQATTTDFWGSMEAVGGPQTYVLGGAFNCGKAQPGQVAAGQPRLPVGAVPRRQHPQHRRRRPADERAVNRRDHQPAGDRRAGARSSHRRRLRRASPRRPATANLRWAGNTLTTNGVTRGRTLTVIATVDGARAPPPASCRAAVDLDDAGGAGARRPRQARPRRAARRGRAPLVTERATAPDWADAPAETSIDVFADVRAGARRGLRRAPAPRAATCSASPSTQLTTTYLGTSAGLRLRHDQPTGTLELNGKSHADWTRSAWAGAGTRDFTDVDSRRSTPS